MHCMIAASREMSDEPNFIDSLYTGYPTGYLIISQSPNIKLKDGTLAEGKKIINERLGQFARWT